jgi:hypothetical protein
MGVSIPTEVRNGMIGLLVRDQQAGPVDDACLPILLGKEPNRRTIVAVTVDGSAEELIDACIGHQDRYPANMRIVDVGNSMRSMPGGTAAPAQNVIHGVADVQDLASIRSRVRELVTEPVPSGEVRTVYLDSLCALLNQVGAKATFNFIEDIRDLLNLSGSVGFVRAYQGDLSRYNFEVLSDLFDVMLVHGQGEESESWSAMSRRTAIDDVQTPTIDIRFKLLSDRRRRLLLHILSSADGPVKKTELASKLIDAAGINDDEEYEIMFKRIYTELVHINLPMLEDHNVISVDAVRGEVRLGEAAERLMPLLSQTVKGDLLEKRG